MRWPFSKKNHEPTIPPPHEQRWSIAQGEYGGGQLVVRFNESALELAGHAHLPIKLGFAIPLNEPNERGLPSPIENEQIAAVEDLICQRVLNAVKGIHAMTLTTGTMKEFVFYVAPGADIAEIHTTLRDEVASHDLQCMADEEPDWDSFRQFAP